MSIKEEILSMGKKAKEAAQVVAGLSSDEKNQA